MTSHCDICNVKLPNASSRDQHFAGLKHRKRVARHQPLDKKHLLFFYGFKPGSISQHDVQHYMSSLQPAVNVRNVAIKQGSGCLSVEVESLQEYEQLLNKRKANICGQGVRIKPYSKQPSKSAPIPVASTSSQHDVVDGDDTEVGVDVDKQLKALIARFKLSSSELKSRRDLASSLEADLRSSIFPECVELSVTGSSATGLGIHGCDLDLTLTWRSTVTDFVLTRSPAFLVFSPISELLLNGKLSLEELSILSSSQIAQILHNYLKQCKIQCNLDRTSISVINAKRCSIVSFRAEGGLKCDLSINNALAVNNTTWLKAICASHPEFVDLVLIFRIWLRANQLTPGASGGATLLSSYALSLLLLSVCQQNDLICSLEEAQNMKNLAHSYPIPWPRKTTTTDSLHELIARVFRQLATIDFASTLFSPLAGRILPLNQAELPNGFMRGFINIQDPFVATHNVAEQIVNNKRYVARLRDRLKETSRRIEDSSAGCLLELACRGESEGVCGGYDTDVVRGLA